MTTSTFRAPNGGRLWLWLLGRIVVILVAFAFLGYAAWAGFGNFMGVQNERFTLGLDISPVGWIATITLIVLPLIVFIVCLIVTRRMRLPAMIFVFAVGITLSAIVNLDVVLALPQTVIFLT